MNQAHFTQENAKPSEENAVYWIFANRKKGKCSKPTNRKGKWLIFVNKENVDDLWFKIKKATEEGYLGERSKVATSKPNPNAKDSNVKVICVYTYDHEDKKDVKQIREELRKIGITKKIPYKTNQSTTERKYSIKGNTKISKYYE